VITERKRGVGEDAEKRLIALCEDRILRNLIILRLAPVYDREWGLNLDRRVFAPKKMAYLKFGSGNQEMSALGRPNLVDFIEFLYHRLRRLSQIMKGERTYKIIGAVMELQSTDYAD